MHKKRKAGSAALLVFCSLTLVLLGSAEVQAATNTASAGATWAGAVWSLGHVPTNTENVVINSGVNLTIGTAAVCASLTIGDATVSATTLTVGAGGSLSVTTAGGGTGNLSINPNNVAANMTLAVGAQSATIAGTVTLNTSNTQTISVSSGSISFTRAAGITWPSETLTLSGAGTITFTGLLTHSGGTIRNTTAAGTFDFQGGYTKSGGTFTTMAGETLKFGGGLTNSNSTLTFNASSLAQFYASCTVTPTNQIRFGDVRIDSGVTVTLAAGTVRVYGNWTNNGGTLSGGNNTLSFYGASNTIGGDTAFPNVTIAAGASYSLDAGTTNSCNNLVFTASGTASSLTHTGSASFSVGGTLTIHQPTAAVTTAWNINAGTGSVTGTSTIGGTNNTATFVASVNVTSGTATFGGTVTLNTGTSSASATITVSTGSVTFSSAFSMNEATLTHSGAGTINFNGGYSFASGGSATPIFTTVSGSNVNFGGALTVSGTGGLTLNAGSNATFSGSGNITPTTNLALGNVTVNTGVTATTVSAAGTFTIAGNLVLSGTGTLAGTEPVLLTGSGATLDGSGTLSAASTVSAAHTVVSTSNLTISGTMTINTGVTVTTVSGAGTFTIAGNLVLSGTGTLAGTEPVLLTGSGATLDGSGTLSAASTVSAAHTVVSTANLTISGTMTINNGITVTNNGTVTASDLGSGTGTWLQNASTATLNYSGSAITPTLTATASGNTVNYNGGGAQTVLATNYHHLTLSNAGTKTIATGTTTAGNLTTSGTVTASCSGSLTVTGDVTIGSGTTFSGGSGTIDVNGSLTASGTGFTSTSGSLYVAGNFSVTAGSFTHNSGTIVLDGADATISAAGATLNNLTVNRVSYSNAVILGASLTAAGTVNITNGWLIQDPSYNLTAGAINIGAEGRLRNWGTGTLTLGGALSNSGLVDFNGGGDANCSSATEAQIRSTDATQRAWSGSGTFNMVDVDVQNQGGTANITVYHGSNSGGNNSNWTFDGSCTGAPTAVTLISFTAGNHEGGVLLHWRTGYEVDNLGFHVYREERGHLVRLTPELVAGSALLAGAGTALTAGHSYSWWDDPGISGQRSAHSSRSSALSPVKYWLEDIDLNGTRTWHGPVTPVFFREALPQRDKPELMSELGRRLSQKYDDFWRAQDLKEKLRQSSAIKRTGSARVVKSASTAVARQQNKQDAVQRLQASNQDQSMQWYLATRAAVKLRVKDKGWYRVTRAELIAAGLSSSANPRKLHLYRDGREQPIKVVSEKSGRTETLSAVEFYGEGLDTPSADTRAYWLIEGSWAGQRIDEFRSRKRGSLGASSFPYTVEKKDRVFYFAGLKNGEAESFFGPLVTTDPVDQVLAVSHADPAPPENPLLEVALQGATIVAHRVKVLFNEVEVGEVVFEGQSRSEVTFSIPHSYLLDGDNVVTLVSQGGETDVSLIDEIRLTYWHSYTADGDSLRFTAQGREQLTVDGFSQTPIRVVDVTDPNMVLEVAGVVEPKGSGYAITVQVPGKGSRTLLALTENQAVRPVSLEANQPSAWHKRAKGADLVIIAHRDFLDQIEPLKALRQAQGLAVALIDVEDLYDEFNFGVKSPKAIKDFLALTTANRKTSPRFVLLVGDASFDPKNYLGFGDFDFVPTKLVETTYLKTASDDWFVDFNGDSLPDIAMGRLPVRTAEEAATVISKIINYEQGAGNSTRNTLLVADRNDGFDFEGASEQLETLLPASLVVQKIFRNDFASDADARSTLITSLNQGSLLVNYVGHGSVEIMRGMFSSDDARSLTNGSRLPFIVSMTCLNGFFHDVYTESLAEALLKAEQGGAVAVWASSALTEPGQQAVMDRELMRLLFNGGSLTLGEAANKAKTTITDLDIRRTWILFGDPTTRLR